jgi:hypothetical protein
MQVTQQQPISLFSVLLALLLLFVPGVAAWGAGDTVMLITGTTIDVHNFTFYLFI